MASFSLHKCYHATNNIPWSKLINQICSYRSGKDIFLFISFVRLKIYFSSNTTSKDNQNIFLSGLAACLGQTGASTCVWPATMWDQSSTSPPHSLSAMLPRSVCPGHGSSRRWGTMCWSSARWTASPPLPSTGSRTETRSSTNTGSAWLTSTQDQHQHWLHWRWGHCHHHLDSAEEGRSNYWWSSAIKDALVQASDIRNVSPEIRCVSMTAHLRRINSENCSHSVDQMYFMNLQYTFKTQLK